MQLNRRGFTLTEVLIVCAIIGVLTAIGIPSFKRMVQRSRKIEAKVSLGGLYAAEQAFYRNYTAYGNNLFMVGFVPDGQSGTRIYSVGFPTGTTCSTQTVFTPAMGSVKGQGVIAGNSAYYTTTAAPGDPTYKRAVTVAYNGYSNVCVSGLNAAKGTATYTYILKDGFNASGITGANSNVYSYAPPGSAVVIESNGFFATADGVITGNADQVKASAADRDVWFIDHERTLVNIRDGAK